MSANLAQFPAVKIPNFPTWMHRTEVGLTVDRGALSFQEWEAGFELLKKNDKSRQWQIGDYLNDGEQRFGEDCYQVIDPDEEEERESEGNGETYRSYQWVAQRIPAVHRCTKVAWSLHRDVAAMEPDERNYWLARAADERLSRRKLQKAIKESKEPKTAKEPSTVTEAMKAIHEKAFKDELTDRIAVVESWTEPVAPILSEVYERVVEMLKWQRDRTIERDCMAIMTMFSGEEGTEAPERASDGDIAAWLHARGLIMSKEEIGRAEYKKDGVVLQEASGRLGLMIRLRMLTAESREESRKEGQRGVVTSVYAMSNAYLDVLDRIEDLPVPERKPAQRKDWAMRISQWAPELMPKTEEDKAA